MNTPEKKKQPCRREIIPSLEGLKLGIKKMPFLSCLKSSEAFKDLDTLFKQLDMELVEVNRGEQAHCYTGPDDFIVIRVPPSHADANGVSAVKLTVAENQRIYCDIADIKLAPPDNVILVSEKPHPQNPSSVSIIEGDMTFVAQNYLKDTGAKGNQHGTVLPMITRSWKDALIQYGIDENKAENLILTTEQLNDKNIVDGILREADIKTPETYCFDQNSTIEDILEGLNGEKRYVLKANGSAGGIGVFTNDGRGFSSEELLNKIEELRKTDKLPLEGQVQEFINGQVGGALAVFNSDGTYDLKSIHEQIIHGGNDFVGGKWTPEFEGKYKQQVKEIIDKLSSIESLSLLGPLGIDFIIDDTNQVQVIEVNPRVTGATPMAFMKEKLSVINPDLNIEKMSLNVEMQVPLDYVLSEKFHDLAVYLKEQYGVLMLPQGINPFGPTKILFVNDINGDAEQYAKEQFAKKSRWAW